MSFSLSKLSGWKTYLALAGALLTAWAGYIEEGLTLKEALTATFGILVAGGFRSALKGGQNGPDGRTGMDLTRLRCAGVALVLAVVVALGAVGCAGPGGGGLGVSVEAGGICVGQGDWRLCWNPLDNDWTAKHAKDGRSVVLEYDPATKDYRGALSSAEGVLVYDSVSGLSLEGPAK